MYGKQFKTLIVAMALFGTSASVVKAGPGLNCDAYAKAAVKQAKENKQRSCHYKGSLWSSSYNGHKNWCLSAGVKMANLTWGDRERARLLNECKTLKGKQQVTHRAKEKLCLRLAREKRTLQKQVKKSCGKGSWPASLKQDVDHCMKISPAGQVQANTKLRNQRLACNRTGATKTFNNPRIGHANTPVSYCAYKPKGGSRACGTATQAAEEFCKYKGYRKMIKQTKGWGKTTMLLRCLVTKKTGEHCYCRKSKGTNCPSLKQVVCKGRI